MRLRYLELQHRIRKVMSEKKTREKPHRLPAAAYVGEKTAAFTILVKDRQPLFREPPVLQKFCELLIEESVRCECDIPIYCFMPDHLHLMVRGRSESSLIKGCVDKFKLRAGIWVGTNYPNFSLHTNYWDHVVRGSEDWRNQAVYIALNPVRAGLVDHAYDYPGTGCIGINRDEMFEEIFFG